jgi:hypothetical protein
MAQAISAGPGGYQARGKPAGVGQAAVAFGLPRRQTDARVRHRCNEADSEPSRRRDDPKRDHL